MDTRLTDHAPAPDHSTADGFALVGRYNSQSEAAIAQSLLRASGLYSFLADQDVVRSNWLYMNAVGGMRLFVREADAARAADILLYGVDQWSTGEINEAGVAVDQCPECGSASLQKRPVLLIAAFIAILGIGASAAAGYSEFAIVFALIAFGFAAFAESHVCRNCDHRWTHRADEPIPPMPDISDLRREAGVACPACASEEVYRATKRKLAGALLLSASWTILFLPMALISVWSNPQWFCRNCGNRW